MQSIHDKIVLIVTPYAEPEKGACTLRVNFFKSVLEKQGCKVFVLAPCRKHVDEAEGVLRHKSKLDLVSKMFWIFNSHKGKFFVIGVSPPLFPNIFVMAAAKLGKAKFILDAKDDGQYYQKTSFGTIKSIKRIIYLAARKIIYKSADSLMFLSNSDLKEAKENYSIPNNKMHFVMNGTNTTKIFPDKAVRAQARKKLGIPENSIVIVYAGSLGDEEISTFIGECSDTIKSSRAKLLLVVAYENSSHGKREIESLKSVIKSHGLEKDAFIFENIPYNELNEYFSASDIGVLPWPENLATSIPVKIFDYASAGLAIAAKAPANSEASNFIHDNNLGFAVSNWQKFKKELAYLIKNKPMLRKIKLQNRIQAEKYFDRSKQAKFLLSAVFGKLF
jgi:glycosyltransferase involved in cell wall biosynthesis